MHGCNRLAGAGRTDLRRSLFRPGRSPQRARASCSGPRGSFRVQVVRDRWASVPKSPQRSCVVSPRTVDLSIEAHDTYLKHLIGIHVDTTNWRSWGRYDGLAVSLALVVQKPPPFQTNDSVRLEAAYPTQRGQPPRATQGAFSPWVTAEHCACCASRS